MTYSAEVLADSPRAYYMLGEGVGSQPHDSSGNNFGGTVTGSPGRVAGLVAGATDGAMDWDGSTTWCDFPALGTPSTISAEALIRLDGNNKAQVVHARSNESNSDRVYKLMVSATDKAEFWVWRGGAWFTVTGATTLAVGSVYHLVGTDDGSNLRIYVNGASDATPVAVTGSITGNCGGLIAAGYNGSMIQKFDGVIDEAAIYHSTLSAARVAAHYAATIGPSAAPADPVGLTDAVTRVADRSVLIADSAALTDLASGSVQLSTSADDAVGITDASDGVIGTGTPLYSTFDDAVGITDSATPSLVAPTGPSLNDPVGVTDDVQTSVRQPGSVWLPYHVADSGSQSLDFSIVPTSPEEPWPFVWEGDGYSNSLWLDFTATGTQMLTITLDTTFDAGIEVWSGDVVDDPENDLSAEGYGQGTLQVAVAEGQHIYMRAHPLSDTETGTGTLTWSVATRPDTGILGFVCAPSILETPGWLGVSLLSAPPNGDVDMALDGGATFATVSADDDGTYEGAVELPALTVGSHTITATDADGQTETETFTVLLAEQPVDTIPGSAGPTTPATPDPVIHWVLEDPMPGGIGTFTFPANPSEMSSPWPLRQLRPERPIHQSGTDVVWEGRPDPVQWTVKGTLLTQAFYDALVSFQALQRRLYLVDHHQRAWIVAFDALSFQKQGRPDDWMHTYEAKFVILGGPVNLP